MIILVVIVFTLIAALQTYRLLKSREYYALAASSVLLLIGLVLNIMLFLGLKIPDPTEIYMALVDSFR